MRSLLDLAVGLLLAIGVGLALLTLLAVADPAMGATTGYGTLHDDDWPPERFISPVSVVEVHFTTQTEIDVVCGEAPTGMRTDGCVPWDRPFDVYMLNPCSFPRTDDYARLICHELAHAAPNNWPSNHPR